MSCWRAPMTGSTIRPDVRTLDSPANYHYHASDASALFGASHGVLRRGYLRKGGLDAGATYLMADFSTAEKG